jgi:hypothetical protein
VVRGISNDRLILHRQYGPSKHHKLCTQWHSIISQKTWIFMWSPKLRSYKFIICFLWQVIQTLTNFGSNTIIQIHEWPFTAHVVGYWLLSARSRLKPRVAHARCGQIGSGTSFLKALSFPLLITIPPMPHNHLSSVAGTGDPHEAKEPWE